MANPSRPVLRAMTAEAKNAMQSDALPLETMPFRIGRESRYKEINGSKQLMERRKHKAPPNNDLYLLDDGKRLNVSRQHFQIEQIADGGYVLVDRGSACGTMIGRVVVGGQDRGGRYPLADGDIIVVGTMTSPFVFQFVLPPSAN